MLKRFFKEEAGQGMVEYVSHGFKWRLANLFS